MTTRVIGLILRLRILQLGWYAYIILIILPAAMGFLTFWNSDLSANKNFCTFNNCIWNSQGDTLITTCTFDTLNKKHVTYGGLGLTDEMCVMYLNYYPASRLEVCKSSISKQSLQFLFGRTFRYQKLNCVKYQLLC